MPFIPPKRPDLRFDSTWQFERYAKDIFTLHSNDVAKIVLKGKVEIGFTVYDVSWVNGLANVNFKPRGTLMKIRKEDKEAERLAAERLERETNTQISVTETLNNLVAAKMTEQAHATAVAAAEAIIRTPATAPDRVSPVDPESPAAARRGSFS